MGTQGRAAHGTWFVSARTDKTSKTAFYAMGRGSGGFRDWLTLLHPPYTMWHLSYVAIGAALVPHPVLWRLGGTLLAFFLAVGIGAHAFDELNGRPLGTGINGKLLGGVAVVSVGRRHGARADLRRLAAAPVRHPRRRPGHRVQPGTGSAG